MRLAHLPGRPQLKATTASARGGQRPVGEEVAGPLGEDAGLARTGRGDDAGAAAGVGDGGELVGREVGVGRTGAEDGQ